MTNSFNVGDKAILISEQEEYDATEVLVIGNLTMRTFTNQLGKISSGMYYQVLLHDGAVAYARWYQLVREDDSYLASSWDECLWRPKETL